MTWKGAGADDLGLRRAVGVDGERQCGPDQRWNDLHERWTVQLARHRHRNSPARRLDKANRQLAGLRLRAEIRHGKRRKEDLARAESQLRLSNPAAARMSVGD